MTGSLPADLAVRLQGSDVPKVRRAKRTWIVLSCLVGVLVAAVGTILAMQSPRLSAYIDDRGIPELSEKIHRKIEVGETHARILFRPHVELDRVTIAGASGEPSLVEAGRASASVELFPFLFSLGKDIRVSSVELDDATVNVVRRPDGTFSYQDVADALKPAPGEAESREKVSVERIRLRHGKVALFDASQGGRATPQGPIVVDQIDATAKAHGKGGRPTWKLKAALGSKQQNVEADVWQEENARLRGHLSVTELHLRDLRQGFAPAVNALPEGALATLHANVTETKEGAYDLQGDARVDQIAVGRDPVHGSVVGSMRIEPNGPIRVHADKVDLATPGIDLKGTASLVTSPTRVRFDLRGPVLDVQKVAALVPSSQPKTPGPSPTRESRRTEGPSPADSPEIEGTLHVDKVTGAPVPLSDVTIHGSLARHSVALHSCRAKVLGGGVDLSGSRIDLEGSEPAWHALARASALDAGSVLKEVTGERPLEGRAEVTTNMAGRGTTWPEARPTLTGSGHVVARDVSLSPGFASSIIGPVARALSKVGLGADPAKVLDPAWSRGGQLEATFEVSRGMLRLSGPLRARLPMGDISLAGQVGLDGTVDLSGPVSVAPPFVGHLTGGKVNPSGPIAVGVQIHGNLDSPKVDASLSPSNVGKDIWNVIKPPSFPGFPGH